MKKIMSLGCSPKAYIRVEPQWGKDDQIFVSMRANEETSPEYSVVLDASGIKKLRKHLKKALEAIEGVDEADAEDTKEESHFPDWFQEGAIVEITDNSNEHEFAIGEKVRVGTELGDRGSAIRCDYMDGHDYWYINPRDFKPA